MNQSNLSQSEKSIEALVREQIQVHPKYSSNIKQTVDVGKPFYLDYHSHDSDGKFCVSIRTGQDKDDELCHIKGFGKNEEECKPLMSMLGNKLKEFYKLDYTPQIFLNGQPLEEKG